MKKVLLFITLFNCFQSSYSQSDALDLSFGRKGIVRSDLGAKTEYSSAAKQVLPLSDGSFYVIFELAGVTQITKKRSNSSPDSAYGVNSYSTPVNIRSVHAVLQTDGKVVIAGIVRSTENYVYNDFGIVRFNTDGSLDKTFADNGIGHTDINGYDDAATSITIQTDGKIVVSGNTEVTHDAQNYDNNTFSVAVVRYNTDGSLDDTFDDDGKITGSDDFVSSLSNTSWVAITSGEKIVIVDFFDNNNVRYLKAARFNSNGSVDNSFSLNIDLENNNGSYFAIMSAVVQNDGKIVIGGSMYNSDTDYNFELARFNTDGSRDSGFGNSGRQTTDFRRYYDDYLDVLALQSDGKIVAAGSASNDSSLAFAIARYNSNGSLDNTFDQDGKKTNAIGSYRAFGAAVAVANTGKLIAAGYSKPESGTNVAIAVYNTNGSLDNTFNGTGSLIDSYRQGNTAYSSAAVQADGKIVVAGYTSNGTNNDFAVARYKTDGSLDSAFSGDGIATFDFGSDDFGNAVAIQADGKIVVAGSTNNGSNLDFAITRLNTNGSPDNTFGYNGKLTTDFGGDENATFVAVQSNGKIAAAGGQAIAKYNSNGFADVSFNGTGKLITDLSFNDFALQSDGKIVAAGRTFGNHYVFQVSRYKSDGSVDNTFGDNGSKTTDFFEEEEEQVNVRVNSVRIQPDGKIVAGGSATLYGRHGAEKTNVALARYNSDGSTDNTFSDDGKETLDLGHLSNNPSIAFRDNGKIAVKAKLFDNIGYESDGIDTYENADAGYAFASLNTNGSLDTTFATGGIQYATSNDDKIQNIAVSNNNLYGVGYTQIKGKLGFLSRYLFKINKAPTVRITSPANNTVYTAPATFSISATANDEDGTISSVKFYNGSTYLKTDFTSPYGYTFNNLAAGTYSITAKATDNGSAQTTSDALTVIVKAPNKAPPVSITSPANNTVYPAPATFTISVAASDSDGTVSNVKFYSGTTYLKTDFTSPYSYTFNNLAAGTYSITAKATDNLGAQTISAALTIIIKAPNKAPTVSITSPANNATFTAPATITINALAADQDGTVSNVKFYNGSTYLKTVFTSPYTYTISNLPAGTYAFTAKATDNNGSQTTSSPVTVKVSNASIVSSKPHSENEKAAQNDALSLSIFPNPATRSINIRMNGLLQNKPATLSIISVSGIVLKTMRISNSSTQLDVSSLASGVYTIRIVNGNQSMYKKFVKL